MAVTRAKKIEQVEKLGGELKNVSSVIVATYSKLTVAKDFELRKALRTSGREVSRGQEHAGRARGQGHEDRGGAEERWKA